MRFRKPSTGGPDCARNARPLSVSSHIPCLTRRTRPCPLRFFRRCCTVRGTAPVPMMILPVRVGPPPRRRSIRLSSSFITVLFCIPQAFCANPGQSLAQWPCALAQPGLLAKDASGPISQLGSGSPELLRNAQLAQNSAFPHANHVAPRLATTPRAHIMCTALHIYGPLLLREEGSNASMCRVACRRERHPAVQDVANG